MRRILPTHRYPLISLERKLFGRHNSGSICSAMFWINDGKILPFDSAKLPRAAKRESRQELQAGRYLSMALIKYRDEHGRVRPYETADRNTRGKGALADAVDVLATTKGGGKPPCLILVRQYRPPHDAYVIEPPAGLMDADAESPVQTGLRELKEETGFTGVAAEGPSNISPPLCLEAGLSACTTITIRATVDLDAEPNRAPRMAGEEGEYVETILAPLDNLLGCLQQLASGGDVIDSKIWTYALALEEVKRG